MHVPDGSQLARGNTALHLNKGGRLAMFTPTNFTNHPTGNDELTRKKKTSKQREVNNVSPVNRDYNSD